MAGLKFRVLLDSKDTEEVFRDIVISDGADFESFYRSILNAYNFSGDQMASFYMSNLNWDKGFEISLFDMTFGEDPDQILPAVMSESTIREYIAEPNQRIILVHDFLRMWIFLIELIEVVKDTPEEPQVALSVGNAPDENSKSSEDDSLRFETDSEIEEEEDEFGFGEFEDGYDDYDF
jgi:hypothetical protein